MSRSPASSYRDCAFQNAKIKAARAHCAGDSALYTALLRIEQHPAAAYARHIQIFGTLYEVRRNAGDSAAAAAQAAAETTLDILDELQCLMQAAIVGAQPTPNGQR